MGDVVGNGTNTAFIYDRRGQTQLLALNDLGDIEWGRRLNEPSEATATVQIPGASRAREKCCADYGKLETWRYCMVVFRDGERSWEGPLRKIIWAPNALRIAAVDVLGWTERRIQKTARTINNTTPRNEIGVGLSAAFNEDDPNVFALRQGLGPDNGPTFGVDFPANEQMYWDMLSSVCDAGGRITTIGRRILYWSDYTATNQVVSIGSTPTLNAEEHLMDTT